MADKYIYSLISCSGNPADDIINLAQPAGGPSPLENRIVFLSSAPSELYTMTLIGINLAVLTAWVPALQAANLTSCADANADKMYQLTNCEDPTDTRDILFTVALTIGDVVNLTGECTCWTVTKILSTYLETATIDTNYGSGFCAECLAVQAANVCDYSERTVHWAVRANALTPDPPDRGFEECCYSNLVFGNLADPTNEYHNDFTSVYYQKQTPNDTVVFTLEGVSTGTTPLVDGTHGVEYIFSATHPNPDLTYFRVSWHDVLSALGEDIYTIRMQISIAGVAQPPVDSNSFILKPWSIGKADNTTRIDCNMDGTLEESGTDFKGSGFDTSLRVTGYFGDRTPDMEEKRITFSSKHGKSYFDSQITMNNDPVYKWQVDNVPECISRQIDEFIFFGNELFISDYNVNNHSYRYELTPVVLDSIESYEYPTLGRGLFIRASFKNRQKNNRKHNC